MISRVHQKTQQYVVSAFINFMGEMNVPSCPSWETMQALLLRSFSDQEVVLPSGMCWYENISQKSI